MLAVKSTNNMTKSHVRIIAVVKYNFLINTYTPFY